MIMNWVEDFSIIQIYQTEIEFLCLWIQIFSILASNKECSLHCLGNGKSVAHGSFNDGTARYDKKFYFFI
jgi:hypothetical protein